MKLNLTITISRDIDTANLEDETDFDTDNFTRVSNYLFLQASEDFGWIQREHPNSRVVVAVTEQAAISRTVQKVVES